MGILRRFLLFCVTFLVAFALSPLKGIFVDATILYYVPKNIFFFLFDE